MNGDEIGLAIGIGTTTICRDLRIEEVTDNSITVNIHDVLPSRIQLCGYQIVHNYHGYLKGVIFRYLLIIQFHMRRKVVTLSLQAPSKASRGTSYMYILATIKLFFETRSLIPTARPRCNRMYHKPRQDAGSITPTDANAIFKPRKPPSFLKKEFDNMIRNKGI